MLSIRAVHCNFAGVTGIVTGEVNGEAVLKARRCVRLY